MRIGTIVMARNADAPMANVLVYASGLNKRPLCSPSTKMGMKLTVIIRMEKNRVGPTSLAASMMISTWGFFPRSRS